MTAYTFPSDNSRARAVSIVPWSTGLLLPRWSSPPVVWRYTDGVLSSAAITEASSCGFSAAATDGASGAWLTQYAGSLVQYTSGGAATSYNLPSAKVFTGVAYLPQYTQPYMVASDGSLYAGSGVVAVAGSPMVSAASPAWGLVVSGATLFTLASGTIATFTLTAAFTGTAGTLAPPMDAAMCLAASTAASAVAVGGWTHAGFNRTYLNMAFAPGAPIAVGLGGSAGTVDLYLGVHEAWQLNYSVSGAGNPTNAAWTPDGTQVLVTDPVSGTVQIYQSSFGSLVLKQTVSFAGAQGVAVTPNGTSALVTSPTANRVLPLALTGTGWASGAALVVTAPNPIVALTNNTVIMGIENGVTTLNYDGSVWSLNSFGALPFSPTAMIAASGFVFTTGTSGASGYFAAVSGVASTFTFAWPGSGTGIIYEQGQVAVTDPSIPVIYVFGNVFNDVDFASTTYPNQPLNNIGISPYNPYAEGGTIFGMGSGSISLYQFTAPYKLDPIRLGMLAVHTSGGWATQSLGSGQMPTAVTIDASDTVWAATIKNQLIGMMLNGTITTNSPIPQFPLQLQSAPIGISALASLGSGLYGASSLVGPLVQLI